MAETAPELTQAIEQVYAAFADVPKPTHIKHELYELQAGEVQAALPEVPTFGAFLFRDLTLPAGSVVASLREQVTGAAEPVSFEEFLDELGEG